MFVCAFSASKKRVFYATILHVSFGSISHSYHFVIYHIKMQVKQCC